MSDMVVFSGQANPKLSEAICEALGLALGKIEIIRFPEGEIGVHLGENSRGRDVFIIQPTSALPRSGFAVSPNDNLMELLIMVDAAKRASADRITVVLPYYGYARQDRKDKPRVPITSKLVANLLVKAGANRILTMDLHANQIQGFFDIPVDHLYSINVMAEYLRAKNIENCLMVSPDVGGIKMARAYCNLLDAPLAVIDKRREGPSKVSVMNIIGDVRGKNVVMVDDIVSTGGSLVQAVKALKAAGALDIYAAVVHPVLAGSAYEKIEESDLQELVVTDSIPLDASRNCSKIKVVSVAKLIAEAIKRIHDNTSISDLFAQATVEA